MRGGILLGIFALSLFLMTGLTFVSAEDSPTPKTFTGDYSTSKSISDFPQKVVDTENSNVRSSSGKILDNKPVRPTKMLFWDETGKVYIFLDKEKNGTFVAQMFYSIDNQLVNSSSQQNMMGKIYKNNSIVGYVNFESEENKIFGLLNPSKRSWVATNYGSFFMKGNYKENQKMNETNLELNLSVEGDHKVSGDEFKLKLAVTNVGNEIAFDVKTTLQGVPSGWSLKGASAENPIIYPGETVYREVIVIRDSESANIAASAIALNVGRTMSQRIKFDSFKLVKPNTNFSELFITN